LFSNSFIALSGSKGSGQYIDGYAKKEKKS